MKWILTAVLAGLLQLFFPWWIIAVAAFIPGLTFNQKGSHSALNGFLGIFALWFVLSLFVYITNDGILAERLAKLLFLPHSFFAVLITGVIGGIVGAFAAFTGNRLRRVLNL